MSQTNHQVRLAGRPNGLPRAADWSLTEEEVPAPGPGQFTVAVSHLSVDPAMRGWMNAGASYVPPVEIGAALMATAVASLSVPRAWHGFEPFVASMAARLTTFLSLDFGVSAVSGRPAMIELIESLPQTLTLAAAGAVLAVFFLPSQPASPPVPEPSSVDYLPVR